MRGGAADIWERVLRWGCRVGVLLLLLVALPVRWAVAQQADSLQTDSRVAHLLQLAQDVRWPELAKQQNFYIEVIGKMSFFTQELRAKAEGLSVRHKPVEIMVTDSWEGRSMARRPNILFVTASAMAYLPQIYAFFSGYPVLVVSERPYYREGWMVSFSRGVVPEGAKPGTENWNYTLNAHNIETIAGLHLSKHLRDGSIAVPPARPAITDVAVNRGSEVDELHLQLGHFAADIKSLRLQLAQQSEVIAMLRDSIAMQQHEMATQHQALADGPYYATGTPMPTVFAVSGSGDGAYEAGELWSDSPLMPATGGPVRANAGGEGSGSNLLLILGLTMLTGGVVCAGVIYSRTARGAVRFVSEAFRDMPVATSLASSGVLAAPLVKREKERASGTSTSPAKGSEAARATQNLNEVHGEFMATMSHEMRTPLNAIMGMSQYMVNSSMTAEEMQENLVVITTNAFELAHKLGSIGMMGELLWGGVNAHPGPLRVHQTLAHVEATGHSHCEAFGLKGKLTVRPAVVGQVGEPMLADADHLPTVLDTLLAVVMRSAQQGVVEVGCMEAAGGVACFVRSAATAMPTAELEALYSGHRAPLQIDHDDARTQAGMELSAVLVLLGRQGVQLMVSTVDGVGQEFSFQPRLA